MGSRTSKPPPSELMRHPSLYQGPQPFLTEGDEEAWRKEEENKKETKKSQQAQWEERQVAHYEKEQSKSPAVTFDSPTTTAASHHPHHPFLTRAASADSMRSVRARPVRIFAATFNLHGSPLPPAACSFLLNSHGAGLADVVCLAFQECGCAGCNGVGVPVPENWGEFGVDGVTRMGGSSSSTKNASLDADFITNIKTALGENGSCGSYTVVGDVAMGEPPSSNSRDVRGNMTEWKGFIRIVVLMRTSDPLAKNFAGVRTMVAPAGGKYPEESSPNEGAVCVFIEGLDLLVVSCHLCGKNRHGVSESHFDKKRRRQLNVVTARLAPHVPPSRLAAMNKVVMGDLNFGVEVHAGKEDKGKRGKDWRCVNDVLTKNRGGESEAEKDASVMRLFYEHDRLNAWMVKMGAWVNPEGYVLGGFGESGGGQQGEREDFGLEEPLPALLSNTVDAIAQKRGAFCHPTFPFAADDPARVRQYAASRTPAWTDRVLVAGKRIRVADVGVERRVILSDHEPVYASLLLERE